MKRDRSICLRSLEIRPYESPWGWACVSRAVCEANGGQSRRSSRILPGNRPRSVVQSQIRHVHFSPVDAGRAPHGIPVIAMFQLAFSDRGRRRPARFLLCPRPKTTMIRASILRILCPEADWRGDRAKIHANNVQIGATEERPFRARCALLRAQTRAGLPSWSNGEPRSPPPSGKIDVAINLI
jgi:hypothetical protein